MKKVILAALASTVIASSASASFYAGVHGSGNVMGFINKPSKDVVTDVQLNREYDFAAGLEVGYNVMENLGVGIEGDMYFSPSYKSGDDSGDKAVKSTKSDFLSAVQNISGTAPTATSVAAYADNTTARTADVTAGFTGLDANVEHQFNIKSVMAKARLDLVDFEIAQIYVKAGLGGSYIGEEISYTTTATAATTPAAAATASVALPALPSSFKVSVAPVWNMAFAAGLGVAFKASDSMFLNLGVEYANMGSTKTATAEADFTTKDDALRAQALSKDGKTTSAGNTKFDAVNLVAGVRFCF
jgi:opacity protein-like surface antigen